MLANLENSQNGPMAQYTLNTLLITLTQNTGQPQPEAHLWQVEQKLLELAGGLTRNSPAQGLWVSPTTRILYHDIVVPFQIVTDTGTEQQLISLAADIAQLLGQEVIFLFTQPIWLVGDAGAPE